MYENARFAQVDLEDEGEKYDNIAATLRNVALARPKKELSFAVADFDDVMSLASRFKVRYMMSTLPLLKL